MSTFEKEHPYRFICEYPNVSEEMIEQYAGFLAEADTLGTVEEQDAYAFHAGIRTDGIECARPTELVREPTFEEGGRLRGIAHYFLEAEDRPVFEAAYQDARDALQNPVYDA